MHLWCGWGVGVLVCWSVGPVSELSEFDWRAEGLTSWRDWRIGVVGKLDALASWKNWRVGTVGELGELAVGDPFFDAFFVRFCEQRQR